MKISHFLHVTALITTVYFASWVAFGQPPRRWGLWWKCWTAAQESQLREDNAPLPHNYPPGSQGERDAVLGEDA